MGNTLFFLANPFYSLPVLTLACASVIVERCVSGRGRYYLWELPTLLIPGSVWLILFLADPLHLAGHKSLSNGLAEPLWIGLLCGVLFSLRTVVGVRVADKNKALAAAVPLLGVAVAAAVFILTPTLRE